MPAPKIPEDPNRVANIVERIRRVQSTNNPKGLPRARRNVDETDADFPKQNILPRDPGWMNLRMITGSGYGPEFGAAGMP